ncbi:MAG: zf-HC2 domain-containing protein [Bacteroidales bacterium]
MKCEEVGAFMIDYLDNKLESGQKAMIEKHLETCEACLDQLRDFQELLGLIADEEPVMPDDSIKVNFYHMLHNELKRNEEAGNAFSGSSAKKWDLRYTYMIAAGIALLICGSFIGMLIFSGLSDRNRKSEIVQLRSEVNDLKKTVMFTMLKDGSSSYRIEAVGYAYKIDAPDQNLIEALVETLDNDKNVNVRLAAAYALEKFQNMASVRTSLVNSLTVQTDPILQVTLINILVGMQEKSAIVPIEKIISNDRTLPAVRNVAEERVRMLI